MHTKAKKPMYRMPVVFGPTAGPRQAPPGVVYDPENCPARRSAYARFHTDASALAAMLPPNFEIRGEPLIAFEFTYMTEIDWLAGRGYNMLTVRIPVRFTGSGQPLDGWFQPVIWENLADPIISGREELGFNKIYADLPPATRYGETQTFCAEWMGFRFMTLKLHGATPAENTFGPGAHLFHHKYVPATQAWGEADADYIVMTPAGNPMQRVLSHHTATAELLMHRPRWEDMPTQFQIVQKLADIPLQKLHSAGFSTARGGKDLSDQVRFL